MSIEQYADCFTVINGPEDGAEFHIVRAPFDIGRDPSCAIHLRLDKDIRRLQAHISVVSEGYRIRRTDTSPVYVNGKRAGVLRSRIIRDGGYMVVGNTRLILECVPDGLARRRRGVDMESDFVWAVREGTMGILSLVRGGVHFIQKLFGRIFSLFFVFGGVAVVLYYCSPRFHYYIDYGIWWARTLVMHLLHR